MIPTEFHFIVSLYTESQKYRTMFIFVFFLVVSDNFKVPCIQINLPVYKDYLCSNFKWFDSHVNLFGEKGKNVILGNTAFCIGIFSTDFSLPVTCIVQ